MWQGQLIFKPAITGKQNAFTGTKSITNIKCLVSNVMVKRMPELMGQRPCPGIFSQRQLPLVGGVVSLHAFTAATAKGQA